MNIAFVCLNADPGDANHATTVRWIEVLAGRPEVDAVTVLALDAANFPALPNVTLRRFRGSGRLDTLRRFYTGSMDAVRRGADAFFVYQGGPYPLLLWPFRILRGIPIYYWKAHPGISWWTRLSARFASTKVFTPSPASFPLPTSKRVVLGHGIDVGQFAPRPGASHARDLITAGRIAPVKHVDAMIRAVARCREMTGTPVRLDIYGPTDPWFADYRRDLDRLAADLDVANEVAFRGPVNQADLPGILGRYRVFLNFSATALDKAVLEAMACGLAVLSTNPAVAEILPEPVRAQLIVPPDDTEAQAAAIDRLLRLGDAEYAALSARLRGVVVRDHNVDVLFDRVLKEMDGARRRRR